MLTIQSGFDKTNGARLPNTPLINPATNDIVFGVIDEMKGPRYILLGADIWLKRGRHSGLQGGFGATHIWEEHRAEMARRNFYSFEEVPAYVAEIIQPGTPVYCEFNQMSGHPRLTVFRSARGVAILELKQMRDGDHYSVVTAYSNSRAHGTRVGTVR